MKEHHEGFAMEPEEIIPKLGPLTNPAAEVGFNLLAVDTLPSNQEILLPRVL
jgi:hypothetical protein